MPSLDRNQTVAGVAGVLAVSVAAYSGGTRPPPTYSYTAEYRHGGVTMTAVTEPLLAAKIEASEARTESKFMQFLVKIDTKLDGMVQEIGGLRSDVRRVEEKSSAAKWTIIAIVIGAALSIAALSYAAVQIFQGGMGATASAYAAGQAAIQPKK